MKDLLRELESQEDKLLHCVHCGFCLPVCPTYTRLADEADSPRGRLHFMKALVDGRVSPSSGAFQTHLDRCLGCRACESVCPSGVEYGRLLEGAREVAVRAKPPGFLVRILPRVMASRGLLGVMALLARAMRGAGAAATAARLLPARGVLGKVRLGMGMVAATAAPRWLSYGAHGGGGNTSGGPSPVGGPDQAPGQGTKVALLTGCIQEGLLGRVNRATARVLAVNGFELVGVPDQTCCGALHAHSGELEGARALARENVRAFEEVGIDLVVVNAAGCGAAMKDYGHLLSEDPEYSERALALAARVRDISEVLAHPALRRGAELPVTVAYDAPCHLLHAQKIAEPPLEILRAIPGLTLVPLRKPDECCGGAGIYGITHPELGGSIGGDKIRDILDSGAELVATGNPGCMMQIGAGLILEGATVGVVHPVELLDESYRRGNS
ncbi:(Fe-S)-binding protein [Gemmatimonadota bacterium]